MTDIATFIRDRLNEDEQWAIDTDHAEGMLPEVQAKAGMLDLHESTHHCPAYESTLTFDEDTPCPVLRWLAYPYAEHPNYDPTWTQSLIRLPKAIMQALLHDD